MPPSHALPPVVFRWLLLVATLAFALDAGAAAIPAPPDPVDRCLKLRRDDPRAAVALAESLLATPAQPVERELKTLSCLGIAAGLLGDGARASWAAERMEAQVKAHPELPADFQLRAHSQAGSVYHGAGRIRHAEAAYLRAYEISHQLDAHEAALVQAATLTNIALIHTDYLDSPEVADGYYRRALAAAQSAGLEDPLILHNHVLTLVKLGRDDEALAAIAEGEAMALRKDSTAVLHRLRAERAGIWIRQGQAERAAAVLDEAIRQQERHSDPPGLAGSLAKRSALQRQSGRRLDALRTAQRAWALVEDTPHPQKQREVLHAWMAAHAALGQAEAALRVGARLQALDMQALKQQRLELLADLQARSENADAQRELERLRHDAQIRTLNDDRSRLLRSIGLAALGMFVLAGIAVGWMQRRRNRQLRTVSATDPLTGLRNRRAASRALQAMAAQRPSPGTRHVVFLIDIDHFKRVNDSFGHHAGDDVLIELSAHLRDACRPGDLIARWGGEEFLVACTDLPAAQACAVAARLQQALGATRDLAPGQSWTLSVSLGFAPFPFFENVDAGWDYGLRMADRALYAAKDHRNAWAGLWGRTLPVGVDAAQVLEQPEAFVRAGSIGLMSSYPMEHLRPHVVQVGEAA